MRFDKISGFGIVRAQKAQRFIRKYHAKAKGGIGWVLFDHINLKIGPRAPQQNGSVKTGGTRADDADFHVSSRNGR
jgi:hypothetical protein